MGKNYYAKKIGQITDIHCSHLC